MRLPTHLSQRTPLRFNITPLIDVVFLLIIFFLVASHFVRSEQAEAVALPTATAGEADDQQALHRLTVTINKDGSLFIAGEPADEASVQQRIKDLHAAAVAANIEPELRLRLHREGRYGQTRKLIEFAASQDIRSVKFAVDVQ
ncbi:ExbD/TolR family protein [Fuerstiella marisgermanici]|uniref:Biopolymer transporter ExbD n=1 Tax=Fuerstiella marisgermanici TaxID=1891926 RepID=A0A1P8WIF6_9PLAN|nr:biopolymer transporter ExbD [Fuerstiella marisgermanici]APZ93833.1 hypothetical protein Fuma_03451 [Fuerstiella marisgermanici]